MRCTPCASASRLATEASCGFRQSCSDQFGRTPAIRTSRASCAWARWSAKWKPVHTRKKKSRCWSVRGTSTAVIRWNWPEARDRCRRLYPTKCSALKRSRIGRKSWGDWNGRWRHRDRTRRTNSPATVTLLQLPVSVVSGFSDEMVTPFPSGTSYASSTTDSQADFFYSSEEESIFYSAMMNPVVKTNLEVPAVTYINGTAPSPNFIVMPDPSPAPSKQMPVPMYQTAFNFTNDASEFMNWSMPTPEQQMGSSPAPSRCSDGSPAPSRFSGSSPAPSRCSDGSPAPARCHDDQAYYVTYAEENFDVSFFSPPALKIKEESEMKLKSQIGGNQDMCDLPVLDTIFLSKFFDSLD